MNARVLVENLLNPNDEPSSNFERFVTAIDADNTKTERQILGTFKRAIRGYIRWVHTDEDEGKAYDEADLVRLRKAKTFQEAEAILAQYESQPSFLYMIRSGYFV